MILTLLVALSFAAPVTLDLRAPAPPRAPLRLGVISGPTGSAGAPDLTARFQEYRIRLVRNNDYYDDRLDLEGIFDCGGATYPSWEGCSADDDANYHWGPSDALMKSFADGGFEPMLRLGGEWQNAGRHHAFKGPQNSTQEHNWIVAATKVARRYRYKYTYLDIWTEFPGERFWDRSEAEFGPFWVKAWRSVKEAVPEARVGGPGFAVLATKMLLAGERRLVARQFLETLHREHVRPDWIGWHIFSNDPAEYADAGKAYRRLLEGTGEFADVPWASDHAFAGVELVLDAFGSTDRQRREPLDPAVVAELHDGARGSAIFAASLIALAETDTTRAYYYRANDPPAGAPRPGGGPGGRGGRRPGGGESGAGLAGPGLFRGDATGTAKRSAAVARLWDQFAADYPTPVAVADGRTSGVWALLHRGPSGSALMVANLTGGPTTVDSLGAVVLASAAGLTARIVDTEQDGSVPIPLPPGPVALGTWGTALLTLR